MTAPNALAIDHTRLDDQTLVALAQDGQREAFRQPHAALQPAPVLRKA